LVVVVELLVDGLGLAPELLVLPPLLPLELPLLPIELVPPELPAVPVLPPLEPEVPDGLVELDELAPPLVPAPSRLLQALSERAAATAIVATAIWVRDVFIGKLLEMFEDQKFAGAAMTALRAL